MQTPAQIITRRASALATKAGADLQAYIDEATEQTGDIYGTKKNLAIALLTMHCIEMDSRNGTGGQVTEETDDGVTRIYKAADAGDDQLAQTAWGIELLGLQQANGSTLPIIAAGVANPIPATRFPFSGAW